MRSRHCWSTSACRAGERTTPVGRLAISQSRINGPRTSLKVLKNSLTKIFMLIDVGGDKRKWLAIRATRDWQVHCRRHGRPTRIICHMRINLVTPFAEKDAVKALGARWDAAKKLWYIMDVADLTPFQRWIPNLEAATKDSAGDTTGLRSITPSTQAQPSRGPTTTRPTFEVPHCGCRVLPWEDCQHTSNGPQ